MGRRWGIRELCAAAALLSAATCCDVPQAPLPEQGFAVRYEKPEAADRPHHRFLTTWHLVELTVDDLNDYVELPHRVTVVARSCHGEGTGYDPETRRIELCYDDLAEQRDLFGRDEDVAEAVRETLYHEAGHALIDALDLPDEGDRAEEDAADRFAQVALLTRDREGDDTLLTAARAYDAGAAEQAPDPTDVHAPDAVRAESHRCAVQGAFPAEHKDLATPARSDCAATWTRTRTGWTETLAPLLRH
ncbi:DUF4344 domain-containing metallopeptidase [Streptomyces sp. 4.24]|uniref:DUF4344 domain-containing metallopeptidase n=1 Tax=Streptomyces tritrimontium TaxID=3406573 RepID=UPI003BB7203C